MTASSVFSFEIVEEFTIAYVEHVAVAGSEIGHDMFADEVASDDDTVADDVGVVVEGDEEDEEDIGEIEDLDDLDGDEEDDLDDVVDSPEGDEAEGDVVEDEVDGAEVSDREG